MFRHTFKVTLASAALLSLCNLPLAHAGDCVNGIDKETGLRCVPETEVEFSLHEAFRPDKIKQTLSTTTPEGKEQIKAMLYNDGGLEESLKKCYRDFVESFFAWKKSDIGIAQLRKLHDTLQPYYNKAVGKNKDDESFLTFRMTAVLPKIDDPKSPGGFLQPAAMMNIGIINEQKKYQPLFEDKQTKKAFDKDGRIPERANEQAYQGMNYLFTAENFDKHECSFQPDSKEMQALINMMTMKAASQIQELGERIKKEQKGEKGKNAFDDETGHSLGFLMPRNETLGQRSDAPEDKAIATRIDNPNSVQSILGGASHQIDPSIANPAYY